MVLKPEPVFEAVEAVDPHKPLILLDPGGQRFDQKKAAELADMDGFRFYVDDTKEWTSE